MVFVWVAGKLVSYISALWSNWLQCKCLCSLNYLRRRALGGGGALEKLLGG